MPKGNYVAAGLVTSIFGGFLIVSWFSQLLALFFGMETFPTEGLTSPDVLIFTPILLLIMGAICSLWVGDKKDPQHKAKLKFYWLGIILGSAFYIWEIVAWRTNGGPF